MKRGLSCYIEKCARRRRRKDEGMRSAGEWDEINEGPVNKIEARERI